jgi:ABC-type nitrate/sulfonate/bicarbonate transport system substrate-binding protein
MRLSFVADGRCFAAAVARRAALAFGAAMLGLCAAPASAQPQLTIGLSSASTVAAAPRVAKELGLFDKQGLNVRFVVLENTSAATTALISKSIDLGLIGPGDLVAAQVRGQKVVLVATAYAGLGGSLVLAKPVADKLGVAATAPIKDRLKALDGVLIGTASATSPYTVAVRGAMKGVDVTPRFTYISVPGMTAALESGAIQGFIASASFWVPPVLRGSAVLWINGPKGELPQENLPRLSLGVAAMRDYAQANPGVIQKVAAVFAELSKAIDERPADVKAAAVKLYPEVDARTLDLMLTSELPAWRSRPMTPNDFVHEIEFVKSTGVQLPGIEKLDPAALLFP